ncbi:GntR family transcriptional regulator [Gemmobacter lanyuensis]
MSPGLSCRNEALSCADPDEDQDDRRRKPDPGTDPADRKRGGGAKLAYETLRDEILDLVLAPGEPIDEASLAERLAMSRTPVREALVRLAGEGW